MPYRKLRNYLTWHWCHNCSGWPLRDFEQREDKPPTWNGQALCEECATRDDCRDCQHSVTLRAGPLFDPPLRRAPVSHRTDSAVHAY
jgi:hypothetical protein